MAYSSDPQAYPQLFHDLVFEIMDNKAKITLNFPKTDKKFKNRIRGQFYGLQRALMMESKRKEKSDPLMSQEFMRRAQRMLRYTAVVEEGKDTVVFISKDILYGSLLESMVVSEERVNDTQAMLIDARYQKVDREIEAVVREKLTPENTSPFKPHSPDDPNSALNQPMSQDDLISLLSGEDESAKKEGAQDES